MWIIPNNRFATPFANIRAHSCTHSCRRDRPNFRLIGYYWNYDSRLASEPRVTVDEYRVTLQLSILFPHDKFWYFGAGILTPNSYLLLVHAVQIAILFCSVLVNFFGIFWNFITIACLILRLVLISVTPVCLSGNILRGSRTGFNFPKHTHHFTAIWVSKANCAL